ESGPGPDRLENSPDKSPEASARAPSWLDTTAMTCTAIINVIRWASLRYLLLLMRLTRISRTPAVLPDGNHKGPSMRFTKYLLLACSAMPATPALAEAEAADVDRIVVTADAFVSGAATKTDTPAIEVPQPVTVIPAEVFEAQGAVSIGDTLNYVAGVQANPYGPDSRVDGGFVRGVSALQFRDGMRDIFSYYASIRADPYNFDSVQVLRGPSSMLFGSGSLGGIVNLNSKLPEFMPEGEVSVRYGSLDRIEALADVTGPLGADFAGRLVARVRDSGTQTDHVPDDRVMVSPSLTWTPTMDTSVSLLGLYQEDDGGSTSQSLPVVGT